MGELETEGYNKTKIVVPIVAMRGGKDYSQYIDLLVPKKATLKLVQGEGPISLVGSHCVDFYGYRDVGAGDDEDEDEEEETEAEAEKEGDAKKSSPAKTEKTTSNKEGGSGGKKRKASEEKASSQEKKKK